MGLPKKHSDEACFTFVARDGSMRSFTPAHVHQHVRAMVCELELRRSHAMHAAPCVVVDVPNCPLFVWTLLACAQLGLPLVALNNRLSAPEKTLRLSQLAPHLEVCATVDESWRERAQALPDSERDLSPETATPRAILEEADPDDLALVMFTSGTTGTPKAAKLSWRQLLASAKASNRSLACDAQTVWQAALPLYHIGGLQVALRSFVAGTPFLLYEHFDAARLLEDALHFNVTHASVVDKMLQDLVAADALRAQRALPRYRCLLLGGAAPNPQTLDRAQAAGGRVFASFGMTETASQVANRLVDGSFDDGLALMDGVEALILDPDETGKGALALRGPSVFDGYLNAPTPRTDDGFFVTGDTARMRDGLLYVCERTSDLFISGGENVYPAEVERCINQVPGVTASYVFGVEDATWGRRPIAIVESALEPAEAEARVRTHVQNNLTRFSQPDRIVVVRQIPRSGIGKIDRPAARKLASHAGQE